MSTPTDTNKAAAALSGPPQRPRGNRANLPKPPAAGAPEVEPAAASASAEPQPEPAATPAPAPAAPPTPEPAITPAPSQAAPAVSKARKQLAARNAEQTFLPLVSRLVKLREYVEQAELAIADAVEMGVDRGQLEDTLRSIARKADVRFVEIPESVRKAVSEV